MKAGAVNCDKEEALCKSKGVLSFPHIQFVIGDTAINYDGEKSRHSLSAKSVFEFVQEVAAFPVINLRLTAQAKELLKSTCNKGWGACLVLFTSKFETSLLLKSLSYHFRDKINVAEVRGSNKALSEYFVVEKYPSLVMVCGGSNPAASQTFEGDVRKFSDISIFVTGFERKTRCNQLKNMAAKAVKGRREQLKKALYSSKSVLDQMRVRDLREIVHDLGVNDETFTEKADFVRAILSSRDHVNSESQTL